MRTINAMLSHCLFQTVSTKEMKNVILEFNVAQILKKATKIEAKLETVTR